MPLIQPRPLGSREIGAVYTGVSSSNLLWDLSASIVSTKPTETE